MAATKNKAIGRKASKKSTAKAVADTASAAASKRAASPKTAVAAKAGSSKAAPSKAAPSKTAPSKAAAKRPAGGVSASNAKPTTSRGGKVAKAAPSAPAAKSTGNRAPVSPVPAEVRALTVGDTVPPFQAVDQEGSLVTSASLAGAPYVIYFYPKDDTPGCTTQACGFRDEMAVFAERGVKVIGVSPDSSASHARFAQKYGLGFTLLADTEKKLVTLFGVWKLKQNYGREYWGVERSTFVVDASGKIAKQWRGVKVAGHVPAVFEAVGQL